MTLDELLLEWSYRSDKGYPCLDSPSDILVLKQILKELDLPTDNLLNRLSESPPPPAPLSVGELRKERDPHRADIFLQKVEKGEEFELMNGSKIIIDKEQSAESLEYLQNKNFPSRLKLTFTDTSGNTHPINSFLKTAEFGAGAGSGAGSFLNSPTLRGAGGGGLSESLFKRLSVGKSSSFRICFKTRISEGLSKHGYPLSDL
jgi:hypothetical protein